MEDAYDDRKAFAEALNRELKRAGISRERAAAIAGIHSGTVWRWTTGATLPGRTSSDPALFWTLVEKNRLNPRSFTRFVKEKKGRIRKTCPKCGRVNWPYFSELRKPDRKVAVNWERREATGLCRRCVARRNLRSETRLAALLRHVKPELRKRTLSAAKRGETWAKKELQAAFGPVTHVARSLQGRKHAPRPRRSMKMLLRGARTRPLGLCKLCSLIVEAARYRRRWIPGFWHPECLRVWLRSSGQRRLQFRSGDKPFQLPSRLPRRGRPFDEGKLGRNLNAFLRYRAFLLGFPGGTSQMETARLLQTSRPNVHREMNRGAALLPGDWNLVFRELKKGAVSSLQKLYQLPDQAAVSATEEPDELVRWLSDRGMAVPKIAALTAVPLDRVLKLLGRKAFT